MNTTGLGFALALFFTAGASVADWPTARQNPRRTGVSGLGSDIVKPAVYWRARLGGALGPSEVLVHDLDGDGALDMVVAVGGQLVRYTAGGSVVWSTGPRDLTRIEALVDLDLDGTPEVIASGLRTVGVVSAISGQVLWSLPPSEIGTPGAIRVGDVDAKPGPELWVDTCGCCAIESGNSGVIYSFPGGLSAPVKLGVPPHRPHCGAQSDVVADIDGDGKREMVSMSDDTATAFDSGGAVIATSQKLPAHASAASCEVVNLDGDAADEIVCFSSWVYSGAGLRGLFAVDFDASKAPPLRLLWSAAVSPLDAGDARAAAYLTSDLDGDGQREAVVSGKLNDNFTARVLDAQTGAELASVPGVAVGDIPAPTGSKRLLLVKHLGGTAAFAFTSKPAGLSPVWQVAGFSPLTYRDWGRGMNGALADSLLEVDLNGDSAKELVVASATDPAVLVAYGLQTGTPVASASHALDPGVQASAVGPAPAGGLWVSRNDGFLTLLDASFKPTNLAHDGVSALPGLFVGGFYTGRGGGNGLSKMPIGGRLHGGATGDALFVGDSRGDLVRIDVTNASNAAPAKAVWRSRQTFGAALHSALPGSSASGTLGAFRRVEPVTDPPKYELVAFDGSGKEVAKLALPRPPQWDVLPGDFLGNGTVAFVGLSADSSLNTEMTCMSAGGAKLWQTPVVNNSGTEPFAVADWDGDGADDVISFIHRARVHSGKSGTEIAASVEQLYYYFMPMVTDLAGDAKPDLLLQGGYLPIRALDHNLATLWVADGPKQPLPYGSLVKCPSGLVHVGGTQSEPARLTRTSVTGSAPGVTSGVILASGNAYPDVASAQAAKSTLGQLTDAAGSPALAGGTGGPTVLVGSTDGFLYAVDACSLSLRWSYGFGMPVSSPVLLDTDGNGKDEILVSVADGYLHALQNEALAAPEEVLDTDPPHGVMNLDVDEIESSSMLHAKWSAVPGASSYEVAVVGGSGAYVSSGPWQSVGNATSASVGALPLFDGAMYRFAVRAVGPLGVSPDVASDGVVVHAAFTDAGVPDAGPGPDAADGEADAGVEDAALDSGSELDAGERPVDILSGRACTCRAPGIPDEGIPFGLAVAVGSLVVADTLRRRRRVSPPN